MKPNVYIFNPTCEMAIANGTVAWQPNRMLRQFETDLAILPAYLAEENDWIIVNQFPSEAFVETLLNAGYKLPRLIHSDELNSLEFNTFDKGYLKPWGWSPALFHKLKYWHQSFSNEFKASSVGEWNSRLKQLYSRSTARDVMIEIESKIPALELNQIVPKICSTEEELCMAHLNNRRSMLKSPWSSSGRGVHPVFHSSIDRSILQWARGVIRSQGYLMVERLLDRKLDFAYQFHIHKDQIVYLGNSWFFTDDKGNYMGNWLRCPDEIRHSREYQLIVEHDKQIVAELTSAIRKYFVGQYEGYLGVDAMVFEQDGQLMINPCVEINVRTNMGILAMRLAQIFGNRYDAMRIIQLNNEDCLSISDMLALTEVTGESKFCAQLVSFK